MYLLKIDIHLICIYFFLYLCHKKILGMGYYICSDSSIMFEEDFIIYLNFLKEREFGFIFQNWVDISDFSSTEFYNKMKEYAKRTN